MTTTITLTEDEQGLLEEPEGPFAPETLPDGAAVFSRQWRGQRSDGLYVIVTYSVAPMIPMNADEPDSFDIQDSTLIMLSHDPEGREEVSSDYEWDYPNYVLVEGIERANAEARRYCEMTSADMFSILDSTETRVTING